jgi:hypothetical protein
MKLAVADIQCDDTTGTSKKGYLGESTRGRTNVKNCAAAKIEIKPFARAE